MSSRPAWPRPLARWPVPACFCIWLCLFLAAAQLGRAAYTDSGAIVPITINGPYVQRAIAEDAILVLGATTAYPNGTMMPWMFASAIITLETCAGGALLVGSPATRSDLVNLVSGATIVNPSNTPVKTIYIPALNVLRYWIAVAWDETLTVDMSVVVPPKAVPTSGPTPTPSPTPSPTPPGPKPPATVRVYIDSNGYRPPEDGEGNPVLDMYGGAGWTYPMFNPLLAPGANFTGTQNEWDGSVSILFTLAVDPDPARAPVEAANGTTHFEYAVYVVDLAGYDRSKGIMTSVCGIELLESRKIATKTVDFRRLEPLGPSNTTAEQLAAAGLSTSYKFLAGNITTPPFPGASQRLFFNVVVRKTDPHTGRVYKTAYPGLQMTLTWIKDIEAKPNWSLIIGISGACGAMAVLFVYLILIRPALVKRRKRKLGIDTKPKPILDGSSSEEEASPNKKQQAARRAKAYGVTREVLANTKAAAPASGSLSAADGEPDEEAPLTGEGRESLAAGAGPGGRRSNLLAGVERPARKAPALGPR
eukprot:tig00001333_g8200.t1